MGSVNQVVLLGNLGSDPEVKTVGASAKTVATFRLATNATWTDAEGAKQERTEWHTIEVWGAQAVAVGKYLAKGRQAVVVGELRYDEWEKEGQKHSRPKIVATTVQFVGGNKGDEQG